MQDNDSLFSLIKSLTKSEKSYFIKSISATKNGDIVNNLKLFLAMDQLSSYSDERLKKKIKKRSVFKASASC